MVGFGYVDAYRARRNRCVGAADGAAGQGSGSPFRCVRSSWWQDMSKTRSAAFAPAEIARPDMTSLIAAMRHSYAAWYVGGAAP